MATFLNVLSGGSMLVAVLPGSISWRLRFQTDDALLSPDKRKLIEAKIRELAQKLGISKPIELIEIKGLLTGAQAQGLALFSGRAGIAINPMLADDMTEAELEFFMAHELSHIEANDLIWLGAIPSMAGVITTLGMSLLFPSSATYFSPAVVKALMVSSPAAALGLSVSAIAFVMFSKWREECADKRALTICSDAAQKAGPKFFEKIAESQIVNRSEEGSFLSKLWKKCTITEEGESRFNVCHPPLKTRAKYLQSNGS